MGESISPWTTRRYRVAGMNDEFCATRVEDALRSVAGVDNVFVDFDRAEVVVRAAADVPDIELGDAVDAAGYTLLVAGDHIQEAQAEEELSEPASADAEPEADDDDTDPLDDDEPEPESEPEPEPDEPDEPAPLPAPIPAPTPQRRDRTDYRDAEFEELEAPEREPWTLGRIAATALRVSAYAFVGSLLWVLAYRILPAPFTLLMVSETIFEGRNITHEWVPLERISPNLIRAVIASEDNEFCHHYGFDFKELQDAWQEGQRGGRLRGASTITQQTAKNAFLWPGRSYVRKGIEAYFAVLMETFWPKRRIMEVYLNVIEWGPGIFGAEAAARHWFGKTAARLSPMEAARLAAILPNPNRYRANPPGPYVNGRGYTIQARANSVDLNGDDRCAKP